MKEIIIIYAISSMLIGLVTHFFEEYNIKQNHNDYICFIKTEIVRFIHSLIVSFIPIINILLLCEELDDYLYYLNGKE